MIKMTAATHDDANSDKDYDNKENTHDDNKDPSLLLLLGPTTMMKIRINRATNNQLIIVFSFISKQACQDTSISFIHIKHLYSASSRKLLRSTPITSTVKNSSLR